jgi:hypothetical protein
LITLRGRGVRPGQLTGLAEKSAPNSIPIDRVGQAARDFKTDDEAFQKLLEGGK